MFAHLLLIAAVTSGGPIDLHRQGVALYKQQNYAQCVSVLEKAVQNEASGSPPYEESVLLIGQSYFLSDQPAKAIPWLEKVTGVREANYMLGCAYLSTGRPEQSVVAFARLFDLKPQSASARLMAAQMMLKQQFEQEAAVQLRKAISLDSSVPGAHFLLAEIQIRLEQTADARANLEQELRIDPDSSLAWYRLGDLYLRQQQYALAVDNLQRSIWLNPGYSGPYILLGKCYFREKRIEKGISILESALRIDPHNREANYLLGQMLVAVGRADEGRAILQRMNVTAGDSTQNQ